MNEDMIWMKQAGMADLVSFFSITSTPQIDTFLLFSLGLHIDSADWNFSFFFSPWVNFP